MKDDFGHLLDFLQQLKKLKVHLRRLHVLCMPLHCRMYLCVPDQSAATAELC